jgi:hypothetical protein
MNRFALVVGVAAFAAMAQQPEKKPELKAPPVVAPGAVAAAAPADAKVLIDGK